VNVFLSNRQTKNRDLFLVLAFVYTLATIYIDQVLVDPDVYQQSLAHNLTQEQIAEILGLKDRYRWLTYLFDLVFVLVKCLLTAFVIYSGLVLFGEGIGFAKTMKIVLLAEFLFLIPLLAKTAWFTFVETNFTLERIQSFYPLSLLHLFPSPDAINEIWVYPFQTLNIFEFLYWFVLASGIKHFTGRDYETSLRIVISSYLPCLLLWIVFVMFLTVALTGF